MQNELEKAKNEINSMKTTTNEELQKQKMELSATIERQVNFIDELIKDKKLLTENVASLKQKLTEEEQKSFKTIKSLEKKHKEELRKNKEAWIAAEKLRKEKWEKEKIQEIKEMTNKAIEQQFINQAKKYQIQLQDLKDHLTREYSKEKSLFLAENEAKIQQIKSQAFSEAKISLMKEQAESNIKLQTDIDSIKDLYEQQKIKMGMEYEKRVENLIEQNRKDAETYEKQIENIKLELETKMESMKLFYETQIEQLKNNV